MTGFDGLQNRQRADQHEHLCDGLTITTATNQVNVFRGIDVSAERCAKIAA